MLNRQCGSSATVRVEFLALPEGVLGLSVFALPSASGLGMNVTPGRVLYSNFWLPYANLLKRMPIGWFLRVSQCRTPPESCRRVT